MKNKIQHELLISIIKKNEGINIYKLRKLLNKEFDIDVSYSTVHRYVVLMEAKGLIRTELKPLKYVKKLYSI